MGKLPFQVVLITNFILYLNVVSYNTHLVSSFQRENSKPDGANARQLPMVSRFPEGRTEFSIREKYMKCIQVYIYKFFY